MEQRGSVSQIKKLAANLKRELKALLGCTALCPVRQRSLYWKADMRMGPRQTRSCQAGTPLAKR